LLGFHNPYLAFCIYPATGLANKKPKPTGSSFRRLLLKWFMYCSLKTGYIKKSPITLRLTLSIGGVSVLA